MSITENLARVRAEIDQACRAVGRDPHEVTLLPVSKTHPVSAILECHKAGCSLFAENKVQELQSKCAELEEVEGLEFTFIGHLQTNKAKAVAELAHEFQCLDSVKVAAELDKRLKNAGRTMRALVQVNSSGEPQKWGVDPADVPALVDQLGQYDSLDVRGLMTVAVNGTHDEVAACFKRMQDLQGQLRQTGALDSEWAELSMGMSGDFEQAIAHGSTCVRVGTAIFGARDYA